MVILTQKSDTQKLMETRNVRLNEYRLEVTTKKMIEALFSTFNVLRKHKKVLSK